MIELHASIEKKLSAVLTGQASSNDEDKLTFTCRLGLDYMIKLSLLYLYHFYVVCISDE